MKTVIIVLFCAFSLLAQNPVRVYTDQVQIGDSINLHLFTNSHNYIRLTVFSAVANDTLFVSGGNVDTMLSRVGFKNALTNDHVQVITGVAATQGNQSTYRQFWLYVPGGMRYIHIRRSNAVTTVKYRIESIN